MRAAVRDLLHRIKISKTGLESSFGLFQAVRCSWPSCPPRHRFTCISFWPSQSRPGNMRRSSAFGQLLQGLGRQAGPGSSSCRAPLQQLQHHQRRAVWQPHHAGPSQAQHLRAFSSSCGSPHPARGTLQPRGPACAGKLSLSARLTSTASPSTPFRGLASRPTTRSSPSQPPSPPSQPPLGRRRTYSSGRPPPKPQVKFWPFVLVIAAGTGAYILLVKYRKGASAVSSF